jgi:hypothetical protein
MILLNQEVLNEAAATCSRNKQLTGNVTYLWSMTHKLTNQNWKFIPYRIPSVTPGYAPSWDLFNINILSGSTEVFISTGATSNVNVHLIPGQYFVKIYEQQSPTNLNPNLSYDVVYEGIATVFGVNQPQNEIISYTGTPNSNIFKIYQG